MRTYARIFQVPIAATLGSLGDLELRVIRENREHEGDMHQYELRVLVSLFVHLRTLTHAI